MTSEAVPKALLGVIILESLEEKEAKNKRSKTRQRIQIITFFTFRILAVEYVPQTWSFF